MTSTLAPGNLEAVLGADDCPLTAGEFRQRIVSRVSNGVEQAGDAYAFSPHSDGFTYGVNRWRFVLAEIGLGFDDIAGVQVLSSGGMRVTVLPVGDGKNVLVFPVCIANDAHTLAQGVRIRPSRLRKLLLASPTAPRRELQLMLPGAEWWTPEPIVEDDNPEIAEENAAAVEVEAALAVLPKLPRTIIVGYASNANSGLLQLIIGEATMASDGTLTFRWLEHEDISNPETVLSLMPDAEKSSFADDPEPEYDVIPRQEGDTSGTNADA